VGKVANALTGLCLIGATFVVGAAARAGAAASPGVEQATATPSPTATASPTPTASPSSVASPTQVFLTFANPTPTNPADPCRTGTTSKINTPGDHDEIVVCTFDSTGAEAATDASGARLLWSITGVQAEPSVRFNPSPPPEETGGSGASALAAIDAFQEGDSLINVSLLGPDGDVLDAFSIEKRVFACYCPLNIPTNLTARPAGRFIRGHARSSEPECEPRRDVTLYRRRKGHEDLIGTDRTGSGGEWTVESGYRRGTYYARVSAASPTNPDTGSTSNCLADQSKDVRRG
jgi:hypothetical protein